MPQDWSIPWTITASSSWPLWTVNTHTGFYTLQSKASKCYMLSADSRITTEASGNDRCQAQTTCMLALLSSLSVRHAPYKAVEEPVICGPLHHDCQYLTTRASRAIFTYWFLVGLSMDKVKSYYSVKARHTHAHTSSTLLSHYVYTHGYIYPFRWMIHGAVHSMHSANCSGMIPISTVR